MKKYIIVLKKESEKENFNNELSGLSSLEFVPDRECKTEDIKDTRCCYSFLTDDEAKALQKDSRVKSVEPRKPTMVVPMGFLPNSKKVMLGNPSRIANPLPGDFENAYKNSIFTELNNTQAIEREEIRALETISLQSLDQSSRIENLPSGEGVDVVIVDGIISGRAGVLGPRLDLFFDDNEIVHPEFLDEQGNSRINLINWNSYVGEPGEYPYEGIMLDGNQFGNNSHGLHVAGIACGTNLGWAKKSAIYNISPYVSNLTNDSRHLIAIKNWHLSKGNSRPTVTNHSYGRQYPIFDIRYVNSLTINGLTYQAPRNDTGATATCTIENGKVSSFTVTNPGSGYTNAPTISFNGGGGDEAAVIMGQGSVKKIIVTNTGSGYDSQNPPSITFSAAPAGDTAEGHCEVDNQGRILRVIMTNRGSGYLSPPSITFSAAAAGVTATAECEIGSNFIKRIQMLNSVTNEVVPGYEDFGCVFRPVQQQMDVSGGIPMLILSGGNCVKEALWVLTDNQEILDDYYETGNGTLTDGIYVIAEKTVNLSETSFSQTLLGGEYGSTPDVSFAYYNSINLIPGPHGAAIVENGEVVSIVAFSWLAPMCFGGQLIGPGWFTSPPQVFITNGGGFTASQLEYAGFRVYPELAPTIPGIYPRVVENVVASDALETSVAEDLIDSGVVFIAAAGNSAYDLRGAGNVMDVNFSYLYKANPSIPYEDNIPFPISNWIRLTAYSYYMGFGWEWGDNVYELDLKGSWAAELVVATGSLAWQCCPEKKASYSNTGTRIDLYAAGDQITSCSYYGSIFEFNPAAGRSHAVHPSDNRFGVIKLSGTSMASPQVCGAVACALTQGYANPPASSSQADIMFWLKENAVSALADLPYPHDLKGGTDKLLYFPGVTVTQQ